MLSDNEKVPDDLQQQYGDRFEAVIRSSQDPQEAMHEIAQEAYRCGLVDSVSKTNLRRDSPENFVNDLWNDNPVVRDRLNLSREFLPPPRAIRELCDDLEVLR